MELLDSIVNECGEAMTREEAEAYREALMGERSIAMHASNSSYFGVVSPPPGFFSPWANICVHNRDLICGV